MRFNLNYVLFKIISTTIMIKLIIKFMMINFGGILFNFVIFYHEYFDGLHNFVIRFKVIKFELDLRMMTDTSCDDHYYFFLWNSLY